MGIYRPGRLVASGAYVKATWKHSNVCSERSARNRNVKAPASLSGAFRRWETSAQCCPGKAYHICLGIERGILCCLQTQKLAGILPPRVHRSPHGVTPCYTSAMLHIQQLTTT